MKFERKKRHGKQSRIVSTILTGHGKIGRKLNFFSLFLSLFLGFNGILGVLANERNGRTFSLLLIH